MPGVMDINHLLCYPSDSYRHEESSLLLSLRNSKNDISISSSSELSSFLSNSPSHHPYFLPPPANFADADFWKHNRSTSTQSTSSTCSSYSNSSNTSNQQNFNNTSSSNNSNDNNNNNIRRRRVNSENYHYSNSADTKFVVYPPSQKAKSRARSNSVSYIQTRTPWTPEEDGLLQKGYSQGLSWAMISCTFLPHRSRGCCWGRFKTLQSKNAVEVYQQRICQRPWKAHANFKRNRN